MQAVIRVLNQIDYSLVSELHRIEKPSATVVMVGQMLCEFLNFLRSPQQYDFGGSQETISWQDMLQQTLKR
jgi:hypothetical protein